MLFNQLFPVPPPLKVPFWDVGLDGFAGCCWQRHVLGRTCCRQDGMRLCVHLLLQIRDQFLGPGLVLRILRGACLLENSPSAISDEPTTYTKEESNRVIMIVSTCLQIQWMLGARRLWAGGWWRWCACVAGGWERGVGGASVVVVVNLVVLFSGGVGVVWCTVNWVRREPGRVQVNGNGRDGRGESSKCCAFLCSCVVSMFVCLQACNPLHPNSASPICLILAPTRELVAQTAEEASKLLENSTQGNHRHGISADCVYGGAYKNCFGQSIWTLAGLCPSKAKVDRSSSGAVEGAPS